MKNHTPVLLHECIEGLNIKPDGVYVDGTLGRGGHSFEIAKRLDNGKLIAIDRDLDAILMTKELLEKHNKIESIITILHGNFRDIARLLSENGIDKVDGMVFDFGMSSPQIDSGERGFSYMNNAKLDMRMNEQDELTAFEVINSRSEEELSKIFFQYGEERYSRQISKAIVKQRSIAPIETTYDLNEVIISAIPSAARREPQHPSKRCFQALRIVVNDELNSISDMLEDAPKLLKKDGRICVISFHSLEDRLVKKSFVNNATGCVCPKDLPICVCGGVPSLKLINKRPIVPKDEEIQNNPRARSAKLRVAEKV